MLKKSNKNRMLLKIYSQSEKSNQFNLSSNNLGEESKEEISMWDVGKNVSNSFEYLTKKQISRIQKKYINFARNRSDFSKLRSQNKYQVRGEFDDQVRYFKWFNIIIGVNQK